MDTDRSAVINIGGVEFELILTTLATKQIAKRYGGLEQLGDKLLKGENFEMALDELIWLIALLANQSILRHNLAHKDTPKEPITEDMLELLTTPFELAEYKNAVLECMTKGTKRHVISEQADGGAGDPKNKKGA